MNDIASQQLSIAVIGLGYVGLPLAIELAKYFPVTGFDINSKRIQELKINQDKTGEIDEITLFHSTLTVTDDHQTLGGHQIFIVTVPTPITENNQPDLTPLVNASKTIAQVLTKGNIIVFESTVYPGVTESVCGEILAQGSGLICGEDFHLGYSPERINPGDKKHTVDAITKVISAQDKKTIDTLSFIYGKVNNNNIFVAKNIKTAEAAKVIENTQRDINIAFINEVAMILNKIDVSIHDVLAAANTKWNFLNFSPGLVGGHCIGVDPYYLAHLAQNLKYSPQMILSGREVNESMGHYLANTILLELQKLQPDVNQFRILILGLTFKENIPDLRNTKVTDIANYFIKKQHSVTLHDPYADPQQAKALYGLHCHHDLSLLGDFDCVIGAVPHQAYQLLKEEDFINLLSPQGLVADIKNLWTKENLPVGTYYWTL